MNTLVVAKTVLVNEHSQILVLRRSATDKIKPGSADFPGGSVDPGEDIMAAAVREIQEEASLLVDPNELVLAYAKTSPPNSDGHILTRLLFIAKIQDVPEITLSYEHDGYRWLPVAEIIDEFDHTSWSDGLAFIQEHNLIEDLQVNR
jgi:8-oxo-dGTP pyrophosphatase MutT (NUDIX family)